MSQRFKESKATTAKHQEQLRAMLKRPENKLCVDCKRNDPRWASTNLGAFLCIRCSGIHRGLGVHISRVRSVDLDTWTPEQITIMDRWGNRKANLYWEAHLKEGHQPPEHKIEAFIRSKYESKRWAMQGPLPDPVTLDPAAQDNNGSTSSVSATAAPSAAAPLASASRPNKTANAFDLLGGAEATSAAPVRSAQPATSIKPPSASTSRAAPASAPAPAASNAGLFDLDFSPAADRNATAAATAANAKRNNADIMSLFAAAPAAQSTHTRPSGSLSGMDAFSSLSLGGTSSSVAQSWNQPSQQATSAAPTLSNPSMFLASPASQSTVQPSVTTRPASNSISGNPWATPAAVSAPAVTSNHNASSSVTGSATFPQQALPSALPAAKGPASSFDLFNSHNVWGDSGAQDGPASRGNDGFGQFSSATPAKPGAFDDLWS